MFTCEICQDKFRVSRSYINHLSLKHINDDDDINVVKSELKRMKKLTTKKSITCEKCSKSYTSDWGLQIHKCKKDNNVVIAKVKDQLNHLITDSNEKDMLSSMIKNEISNHLAEHKSSTNINNGIVQNIYINNVYNIGQIDMSRIITHQLLKDLHNKINHDLDNRKKNGSQIYVLEANNTGRPKNDKYTLELKRLQSDKAKFDINIKTHLVDKLTIIFENAFFDEAYPENHIMYITSERSTENFYVYEHTWSKKGTQDLLIIIMDTIYQSFSTFYKTYKPNATILSDIFYKEYYHDLKYEMADIFRKCAYKHRDIIKRTFDKTQHIIQQGSDEEENSDPDIADIEDHDEPKPTYVLRTQEEADIADGYIQRKNYNTKLVDIEDNDEPKPTYVLRTQEEADMADGYILRKNESTKSPSSQSNSPSSSQQDQANSDNSNTNKNSDIISATYVTDNNKNDKFDKDLYIDLKLDYDYTDDDLVYTKDNIELLPHTHKKKQYYLMINNNHNLYEIPANMKKRKINNIESNDLELVAVIKNKKFMRV